jgi:hypothetical protein
VEGAQNYGPIRGAEQAVDTSSGAGKGFLDILDVFAESDTNRRREPKPKALQRSGAASTIGGLFEDRTRQEAASWYTQFARDLGISGGMNPYQLADQNEQKPAHNQPDLGSLRRDPSPHAGSVPKGRDGSRADR